MKSKKIKKIVPFRREPEFFFRTGLRYADKKMFGAALKFFNKAVEMEPFNVDYHFSIAGVLAELREYEKSNDALANILKDIDPTLTECYFGIGCNYFDLGDFTKAKEYLEKYICFDPKGQFVDEVSDALYYLQIYESFNENEKKKDELLKSSDEGKKSVGGGTHKKPSLESRNADTKSPGLVFPIKWKKEWEAIIECALQNKEFTYKDSYKSELRKIWIKYINKVSLENIPVIKKSEIWAATLEYIYCNLHLISVSKRKLAQKYKISTSSITSKLKDFGR